MYKKSKYSEQKNSSIRCQIVAALEELAINRGISIKEIKTTYPYSAELGNLTSQKISVELNKLIDSGIVVKSNVTKGAMKYMLKERYDVIMDEDFEKFGYGDYRDGGEF